MVELSRKSVEQKTPFKSHSFAPWFNKQDRTWAKCQHVWLHGQICSEDSVITEEMISWMQISTR